MRKDHKTVTAIFFLWSRCIQVDFKKAKGMGENLTPELNSIQVDFKKAKGHGKRPNHQNCIHQQTN
jgi:hypothetical protein